MEGKHLVGEHEVRALDPSHFLDRTVPCGRRRPARRAEPGNLASEPVCHYYGTQGNIALRGPGCWVLFGSRRRIELGVFEGNRVNQRREQWLT